ncbi:MAG: hypothetical protein LBM87_00005 [Ruminococcus sp.]|jgi:hypothetical protein|nr:hypothetical protein [Ruminococcus sp.]
MNDDNMKKYDEAKSALEGLVSQINIIIDSSVNGADPETCPTESGCSSCGGSCSTCGGC